MIASLGAHFPLQTILTGAITGTTYGVLAVGVVLIFRSTRVLNFAIAEMGGLCAAILSRMVINWHVNYWVAFSTCVALGAILGAVIELGVVRRLFYSPRVVLLMATIGLAQVLLFAQGILPIPGTVQSFPTPISSSWQIGGEVIQGQEIPVLIVIPLMVVALTLFLRRTKYGVAIRAAAANPDGAQLFGIRIKSMSTMVWVIAGVLSAVATILTAPLVTTTSTDTMNLGPTLLLRALAAALIARMISIPIAMVAGVVIGIGESLVYFNWPNQQGLLDLILLGVILLALIPMSRQSRLADASGGWSFSTRVRPLPAALQDWWVARNTSRLGILLALALALLIPVLETEPSRQFLDSQVFIYAIAALSVTMLTGWAGQLSLGQFGIVGLGAASTVALTQHMPFGLAVLSAGVIGFGAALVIGASSLRMSGLLLAIPTLAFSVAASSWFLGISLFTGGQLSFAIARAHIGPISLASEKSYYYFSLICFALIAWTLSRLRKGGFGRSLIAVRDNERAVASFGLSPARIKLKAFGFAGGLAGLAGGLLAGLLGDFSTATFSPEQSLALVSVAVIGGLTSVTGAVLGAVWVIGIPALFNNSSVATLLASGAGLLVLLLYFPAGLVQVLYSVRDIAFERVARRRSQEAAPHAPDEARVMAKRSVPEPDDVVSLVATGISVRFGGRHAVDGVDLHVDAGEIVGLIGANGAGKSTLMNAIGGFVPSEGTVTLLGQDATHLPHYRRARLGVGRTFQGAELFGDLTVLETIQMAMEHHAHAGILSTALGSPRSRRVERHKRAEAEEILTFLGLGQFSDRFINELSTGTRRITELACLIAADARFLCLDEPTAGIAQRETEAFAPLLQELSKSLGASVLIIEHDMPMLMGISHRVYCMETGRIICEGPPQLVRNDPAVIASYLGTNLHAVERSGTKTIVGPDGQARENGLLTSKIVT
jgi:ABC-type branched-subunit amino acid transport system ATPase component/ABC-type branched-subunit amino acid transport system permease subunit